MRHRGFSLLELMLVVAIIAICSAAVMLNLPDPRNTALQMEAQRLAAVLDAAHAQARTTGLPVRWRPVNGGFVMESGGRQGAPQTWQTPQVSARSTQADGTLILGAEPVMAAQTVRLWLLDQPQTSVEISTDGLHPFALAP